MRVHELDKDSLETIYNVHYTSISKYLDSPISPVEGMIGIVSSGESSTPHKHNELELFIVLSGSGIYKGGNDQAHQIEAGSIQLSQPFTNHYIENTGDEDLIFVSLWWSSSEIEQELFNNKVKLPSKVMIVATPPTPNGNLHLGHLSGPYLAGDVLKRYLISQNVDVKYVTGLDDNQSYVPLKAYRDGCHAEEILELYSEKIKNTYKLADIDLDLIVSPRKSIDYKNFIQEYFSILYSNGKLIEKEEDAYFCSVTGDYIFEAYIRGACPHCGAESDGNACEQCGIPNSCINLIDAKSKFENSKLTKRRIKRLYLRLNDYASKLKEFWLRTSMKPHLQSLCQNLLNVGMMDIAITHPTKWGIPSTIEGYEDQVYYVWAEMAAAFIYMSKNVDSGDDWTILSDDAWSRDSELVHCFGFDNGTFFAALFPSLWWAHGGVKKFPDRFITNEFLCLDKKKFSTSRGHAIWGDKFFEAHDSDIGRFYLAYNSPESYQTNFTLEDFDRFSHDIWVGCFDVYVENLNKRVLNNFGAGIPDAGAWTDQQIIFYEQLSKFTNEMELSYNPKSFSLFSASHVINGFLRISKQFSMSEQYLFDTDMFANEKRTSIQLQLTALLQLCLYLCPIMPRVTKKLWHSFGFSGTPKIGYVGTKLLSIKIYLGFEERYFYSRIRSDSTNSQ